MAVMAVMCGSAVAADKEVPKWQRFELTLESSANYTNPFQEAQLDATFTAPSGQTRKAPGFWDGKNTWKIRFSPNETGKWTYKTACSDKSNKALDGQSGSFTCTAPSGKTRFDQHGPVRVSADDRSFAHEDNTPFFWLADTAWNGALLSRKDE